MSSFDEDQVAVTTGIVSPEDGTLERELPRQGWNIYLIFVCSVFVIASFQFGYATGVINSPANFVMCGNTTAPENQTEVLHPVPIEPTEPGFFKECIAISDGGWGFVVAMFTVGGLIGGLSGGVIADIIGRRNLTWVNNLFFLIGYLLMSIFSNVYVLCVGRFFIGLGAGIASSVVPMYLSEISPIKLRGAIGVLPQLGIVIGILVSQLLSIPLSARPWQWRLLFGIFGVLPILQMALLPLCPESPKWFLSKRANAVAAENALRRLRRGDVSEEMEQEKKAQLGGRSDKVTFLQKCKALFRRELWRPLIVGVGLQMCQQLSGVNVVFAFSTNIFETAGLAKYAALCTVLVGLVNVIATIVVIPLMDRLGRRTLLIIGEIGCAIFFGVLALSFILQHYQPQVFGIISVICVVGFVISFAIALGPIPWLIISEIFPSDVRPLAVSIATTVNWTCNFVILLTFNYMKAGLKQYTFLPYTGVIVISIVFTVTLVMETKGKTVEQIVGFSSAVQTEESQGLLVNNESD
jgi:sugar porter (SP) family MFS transporter